MFLELGYKVTKKIKFKLGKKTLAIYIYKRNNPIFVTL